MSGRLIGLAGVVGVALGLAAAALVPRDASPAKPETSSKPYRTPTAGSARILQIPGRHRRAGVRPNLAASASGPARADVPPYEQLLALFAYDRSAPLALRTRSTSTSGGIRTRDLSFASPAGGRVTAYLVEPTRKGRFGAAVFLHPHPGGRATFLGEACSLARAGVVSLLLDSPFVRPPRPPLVSFTEADRELLIRSVVELRRGADLLAARANVDAGRLAFVGRGYGASMGGVLAGVDRRFRAFVLMGKLFSRVEFWRSEHPTAVAARRATPETQWQRFLAAVTALDAVHYLPHSSPGAVLFQLGRRDTEVPEADAARYVGAAGEPRLVRWYEAGAALNAAAATERRRWLLAHVGAPLPRRASCVAASERARVVRFVADDATKLLGVALGQGRGAVALGHERGADLCSWLPFARTLAAAGVRVLAFDFRGHGSSGSSPTSATALRNDLDFAAAVSWLRGRGAERLGLAGASMGGTAAVVTAAARPDSVAAVVSMSAPSEFRGQNALESVRRLRMPTLFVAARDDAPFAEDAQAMYAAAGSVDKQLLLRDGVEHGTQMLCDPDVAGVVSRFLLERLG